MADANNTPVFGAPTPEIDFDLSPDDLRAVVDWRRSFPHYGSLYLSPGLIQVTELPLPVPPEVALLFIGAGMPLPVDMTTAGGAK